MAKLNGVNPEVCLRFVPTRIADPINRIDELIPWVVGAQFGSAA
ncbi:transposase domain-containing protein [Paraburkholderia fungorum]